ncbi:MAG: phage tail protein [Gemmatimonadaceae bacterium]|nr:phage tail protein [Gemmatimonadaceae bacterium]
MAVFRDRPYTNFNFLVDLGTGATDGPEGGFEEVQLPEVWLDVIEYRNGNERENSVRKLTGLDHVGNLVLRRGVIGSLSLYQWYNQIRNGDQTALRTVTVQLQNEDHTAVVQTWRLLRARLVRLRWGPLNGRGNDVAVEYAEIAGERLELE